MFSHFLSSLATVLRCSQDVITWNKEEGHKFVGDVVYIPSEPDASGRWFAAMRGKVVSTENKSIFTVTEGSKLAPWQDDVDAALRPLHKTALFSDALLKRTHLYVPKVMSWQTSVVLLLFASILTFCDVWLQFVAFGHHLCSGLLRCAVGACLSRQGSQHERNQQPAKQERSP